MKTSHRESKAQKRKAKERRGNKQTLKALQKGQNKQNDLPDAAPGGDIIFAKPHGIISSETPVFKKFSAQKLVLTGSAEQFSAVQQPSQTPEIVVNVKLHGMLSKLFSENEELKEFKEREATYFRSNTPQHTDKAMISR